MKMIDTLRHIKDNPKMYLPHGDAKAVDFAVRILMETLSTTPYVITVQHSNDWWIISCEEDWIRSKFEGPVEDFFERIVPLPELGDNAFCGEVLLTVFAFDVATATPNDFVQIKGFIPTDDIFWLLLKDLPKWKRIVAFRMAT